MSHFLFMAWRRLLAVASGQVVEVPRLYAPAVGYALGVGGDDAALVVLAAMEGGAR